MRSALLVYENTLFAEMIAEALAQSDLRLDVRSAKPGKALRLIGTLQPELILLDETIDPAAKETLLHAARQLPNTEVVLMHPQHNTLVHFTVRHSALTSLQDFGKVLNMAASEKPIAYAQSEEQARCDQALARASVYGFLAAIFNHNPDLNFVEHLQGLTEESISTSCMENDLPLQIAGGIAQMAAFIDEVAGQPVHQVQAALAQDWTRLFRGVQRGYGPEPPYANLYQQRRQAETQNLHALIRTYAEHNARPASGDSNRPDYLGVMLDFLRFLFEREAEAWAYKQPEQALTYRGAADQFRQEYLGEWVQRFCEEALNYAETGFYRGGLQVTKEFMEEPLE